jgi:hypothetical protein
MENMLLTNVSRSNFDTMVATLTNRHQQQISKKEQSGGRVTGQITGHGTTITYTYDEKPQTLSADILHHPFWVREAQIENGLRDAMIPAKTGAAGGTEVAKGAQGSTSST